MGACHGTAPSVPRDGSTAAKSLSPHLQDPVEARCPVSGAAGECPLARTTTTRSRFKTDDVSSPSPSWSSGDVIQISQLPKVTMALPSAMTVADLEEVENFPSRRPLSAQDVVVVKGAWNRIIAWKDAAMEAMVYRWALLDPEVYDVLRVKFDELPHDMFQLIDQSVRNLDKRTEVHHRESYTPGFPACVTRDFGEKPADIISHYVVLGVRPKHWASLKAAFMFAMRTHNPYCYKDHDQADLDLGEEGAICRFFHLHIVNKTHAVLQKLVRTYESPEALIVQRQAEASEQMQEVAHDLFARLLSEHPELCDYFDRTDMDYVAEHFAATLALVGRAGVGLRDELAALHRLAQVHRIAMIPSEAYTKLGDLLLETLAAHFEMPKAVQDVWYLTFMSCATVISAPTAVEERLYADAEEFFTSLASELHWGAVELDTRLRQVKSEIGRCGTYRHTAEEIQTGARLAWRNSPKCIGRIVWDTLLVRDRRHVASAAHAFEECREHLRIAAGGGIMQSVMTVFAPKKPNEQWGMRFWNAQLCRYAGYRQPDGSVLGDPANADFTEMVMKRFGWQPPRPRTRFDPLPQVIQLPGQEPQMCEFDRRLFCEIQLTHPDYPEFAHLGLKWTSIPAITGFNMNLGGISYPCCPFSGWFVDLEIARNLVERYDVGRDVAAATCININNGSMAWRSKVIQAVSEAVTHSFQQSQFSIVDHYTASTQFLQHVDREKQCGREVPAQWSWIGGFAGVHCPVWHYEMRDFYLRPQFHYQSDRWVVEGSAESEAAPQGVSSPTSSAEDDVRAALILHASTTGTSERFANLMAKELGMGYRPRAVSLGEVTEQMLQMYTHVICFVSTFADGEAPANGLGFELPPLLQSAKTGQPLRYAVMALGSRIYPAFCAFGKHVDKAFEKAGCKRFVHTLLSDACGDQEADFANFLAGVRNELGPRAAPRDCMLSVLEVTLGDVAGGPPAMPGEIRGHVQARVVESQLLMSVEEEHRATRRISIDISGAGGYRTGWHLSVLPCNPEAEVLRLAAELGIAEEQLHASIEASMVEGTHRYPAALGFTAATLREALRWHVDITVRRASLPGILEMVRDAGGMTAEEYAQLMEEDAEKVVARYWWLSRLLRDFPSAKGRITLGALFSTLPRQFPRLYSIASSSLVSPNVVDLCVGLVNIDGHLGLASSYLHSLEAGSAVWVSVHKSAFTPPESLAIPLVMVGAGTGVAPFAGFVQERMESGAALAEHCGKAHLFFGCRSRAEVLYEPLFTEALGSSALTGYSVALSREPGQDRRLVTSAIRDSAEVVWDLLRKSDCEYYVCGDRSMADTAYEGLLHAISQEGKMSRARAVAFVDNMRAEGRYHLDVWGGIAQSRGLPRRRGQRRNGAAAWLDMVKVRTSPVSSPVPTS